MDSHFELPECINFDCIYHYQLRLENIYFLACDNLSDVVVRIVAHMS